jgi:hypothetical protein
MNARFAVVALVFGSLAIVGAFASVPACSSDDAAADGGAYLDVAYIDAPTTCDLFTEVGAPCPAVSKTACFPMCTTGGCFCSQTSDGPRWTCTTDFSCVPEAGPLEDAETVEGDAGVRDADASDAGDATVDAGADAHADADADAGAIADADASADAND